MVLLGLFPQPPATGLLDHLLFAVFTFQTVRPALGQHLVAALGTVGVWSFTVGGGHHGGLVRYRSFGSTGLLYDTKYMEIIKVCRGKNSAKIDS